MITPKPVDVDTVQTDWNWWDDDPKEETRRDKKRM